MALGLRRPTILLPTGLVEDGSPQAIRAVLTHEWAHIRNGDLWLLALGRCLLVLLFAQPLFWWLRRAIRGDQELLADAAAAGDNRPAYAEELLRLVRQTASPSPLSASAAVGIWEGSSQLSRRITMLLDETFHVEPRGSRSWRYRTLAVLVLLGAAVSLVTLRPARSAAAPPPAPPAAAQADKQPPADPQTLRDDETLKFSLPMPQPAPSAGQPPPPAAQADKQPPADPQTLRGEAGIFSLPMPQPAPSAGQPPPAAAQAAKRPPADPKSRRADALKAGGASNEKGDLDKAIADYTEAIRLNPKDADAYGNRGYAYAAKGDLDKAIADCTEAIRLNPKDADAYVNRGWAYGEKGDFGKAIADYSEAIRLNPKDADAHRGRGYDYDMKGDRDKAIADYTEAIRLNPKYADAYSNRGYSYLMKGDFDKAIADYTEAVRLNPKYADAYCNRGWAYWEKDDFDKAVADYTEAIRLNPKDALSHENRGYSYGAKGDFDKAIADYTEAIRMDPKSAWAYFSRGHVYGMTGDPRKAVGDYTEAIRLNPKDATAYQWRSVAYGQLGEQDKASADAAEAERLQPSPGWLPAYSRIESDGALCAELQLSSQQMKKLQEIAKYGAQRQNLMNNLVKQSLKLPQGQRAAWVAQKSREEEKTQAKIVGKQVEEILSPRQLEVYKREAFPDLACAMLRYPEFLKTIGATPEQKERLAKIQEQLERQTQEQERRYNEQSLAVLSPQQQEKLRAEIRRADEPPADGTAVWGGQ